MTDAIPSRAAEQDRWRELVELEIMCLQDAVAELRRELEALKKGSG